MGACVSRHFEVNNDIPGQGEDVPVKLHSLSLSNADIDILFNLFCKYDPSGLGFLSVNAFAEINMDKSAYLGEFLLNIFDRDCDERVTFYEFAFALWHFITLSRENMLLFFFGMYDLESASRLTRMEVRHMVDMVWNFRVDNHLTSFYHSFLPDDDSIISLHDLKDLYQHSDLILFPAFELQITLKLLFMGQQRWNKLADLRRIRYGSLLAFEITEEFDKAIATENGFSKLEKRSKHKTPLALYSKYINARAANLNLSTVDAAKTSLLKRDDLHEKNHHYLDLVEAKVHLAQHDKPLSRMNSTSSIADNHAHNHAGKSVVAETHWHSLPNLHDAQKPLAPQNTNPHGQGSHTHTPQATPRRDPRRNSLTTLDAGTQRSSNTGRRRSLDPESAPFGGINNTSDMRRRSLNPDTPVGGRSNDSRRHSLTSIHDLKEKKTTTDSKKTLNRTPSNLTELQRIPLNNGNDQVKIYPKDFERQHSTVHATSSAANILSLANTAVHPS